MEGGARELADSDMESVVSVASTVSSASVESGARVKRKRVAAVLSDDDGTGSASNYLSHRSASYVCLCGLSYVCRGGAK
jgi:hypothetical protein